MISAHLDWEINACDQPRPAPEVKVLRQLTFPAESEFSLIEVKGRINASAACAANTGSSLGLGVCKTCIVSAMYVLQLSLLRNEF